MYASGFCACMTQMRALRKIPERSRNRSQKIAAPRLQKDTTLPFDVGVRQQCFHSSRGAFSKHFCSNVGTIVLYVGTIVLCQLRRFKAHLRARKAFSIF